MTTKSSAKRAMTQRTGIRAMICGQGTETRPARSITSTAGPGTTGPSSWLMQAGRFCAVRPAMMISGAGAARM